MKFLSHIISPFFFSYFFFHFFFFALVDATCEDSLILFAPFLRLSYRLSLGGYMSSTFNQVETKTNIFQLFLNHQ